MASPKTPSPLRIKNVSAPLANLILLFILVIVPLPPSTLNSRGDKSNNLNFYQKLKKIHVRLKDDVYTFLTVFDEIYKKYIRYIGLYTVYNKKYQQIRNNSELNFNRILKKISTFNIQSIQTH